MATTSDIIVEIHSVSEFLVARASVAPVFDPPASNVAFNMVGSLKAKILSLRTCKSSDALQLYAALQSSSLLSMYQDTLRAAIDIRASGSAGVAASSPSARVHAVSRPQTMLSLYNYLTADDWATIKSNAAGTVSPDNIMLVLGNRMIRLGVCSLSEKTVRHCVSVMLHALGETNDHQYSFADMYQFVLRFKDIFARCKQAVLEPPPETILNYPVSPLDMSEAMQAYAYTPPQVPTSVSLPGLDDIALHIPMRSTSNTLKAGNPKATTSNTPSSGVTQCDGMIALMQQMLSSAMGISAESTSSPLPGLTIFRNAANQPTGPVQQMLMPHGPDSQSSASDSQPSASHVQSPLATASALPLCDLRRPRIAANVLPQRAAIEPPKADIKAEPATVDIKAEPLKVTGRQSSQDYEEAALAALLARNASKKVTKMIADGCKRATDTPAASPVPRKRLRGKTCVVTKVGEAKVDAAQVGEAKVGAAQVGEAKVNEATLTPLDIVWDGTYAKPKNNFKSMYYHQGVKYAKANGYNETEASDFAKAMYAKASKVWNANH
jgi:hypothetical protein